MNAPREQAGCPDTAALMQTLQELLPGSTGIRTTIARLERRRFPYSTSFPLEELAVYFTDGTQLDLLFKNLSPDALDAIAQQVRPAFISDPAREIEIYRSILPTAPKGTARCYGSLVDHRNRKYS